MGNKKILVIGSSNTDMTIKGEKLPAPGETIIGGTFHMGPGGKGANQAVAAQRLGGDVTFICKVGRDIFGENGGFVFNTVHNIQANVPVENVVALMETLKEIRK